MIGAIHVANSFLLKAKKENIGVTPRKLYSLVYLLYSNILYKYGTKLFNEPFQITDEGPIVPSLYYKFNSYGNKKIKSYASNAFGETFYVNNENFNKCLNEIWFQYKDYTENELFTIVTSDNSAYNKARINNILILNDSDILSDEISKNEEMLERAKSLKIKFSGLNGR